MLAEDVIGIDLDDPDGYLTPGAHLETVMHLETYMARPDVGAVIHTHPMYSIALGATAGGLELLSHDGLLFPDGVPVFDGTAGLVTTPQDGQAVARALGAGRAVLLRNHGILVAGEDISWAVLTALTSSGRRGSSSSPGSSATRCRSRGRWPASCRRASTRRSSPRSTGRTGAAMLDDAAMTGKRISAHRSTAAPFNGDVRRRRNCCSTSCATGSA